jgi:hypothetical protein
MGGPFVGSYGFPYSAVYLLVCSRNARRERNARRYVLALVRYMIRMLLNWHSCLQKS